MAHERAKENRNLAQMFPLAKGMAPYIGVLYALVVGAKGAENHGPYAPCEVSDLASKGYAYWALGHVHTVTHASEAPLAVYPGNLAGRHYLEAGPKGAYLVEVGDDGSVKAEFVELSKTFWTVLSAGDLAPVTSLDPFSERITDRIVRHLERV